MEGGRERNTKRINLVVVRFYACLHVGGCVAEGKTGMTQNRRDTEKKEGIFQAERKRERDG